MRDTYRDWTSEDRSQAWRDGDREGCRQYDRAYDNYRNGGEFSDPNSEGRFH